MIENQKIFNVDNTTEMVVFKTTKQGRFQQDEPSYNVMVPAYIVEKYNKETNSVDSEGFYSFCDKEWIKKTINRYNIKSYILCQENPHSEQEIICKRIYVKGD